MYENTVMNIIFNFGQSMPLNPTYWSFKGKQNGKTVLYVKGFLSSFKLASDNLQPTIKKYIKINHYK